MKWLEAQKTKLKLLVSVSAFSKPGASSSLCKTRPHSSYVKPSPPLPSRRNAPQGHRRLTQHVALCCDVVIHTRGSLGIEPTGLNPQRPLGHNAQLNPHCFSFGILSATPSRELVACTGIWRSETTLEVSFPVRCVRQHPGTCTSYRGKLNTLVPTLTPNFPNCLPYPSVFCKSVKFLPCTTRMYSFVQ